MSTETEDKLSEIERVLLRRIWHLEKTLTKYHPAGWELWNVGELLRIDQIDSVNNGKQCSLKAFRYLPDGEVLIEVEIPGAICTFVYPPAFLRPASVEPPIEPVEVIASSISQPPPQPEAPAPKSAESLVKALKPILSIARNSPPAAKQSIKRLAAQNSLESIKEAIALLPSKDRELAESFFCP